MASVKPEQIIEILRNHNVHISFEQAVAILNFVVKFANIALSK